MHVETPPLKHLTASGKPRSLFMDIQHPVPCEDESSNSSSTFDSKSRVFSYRKYQPGGKREWWDAPSTTVRRDPAKDVSVFEFDIPEHLPSSPMCPANPKHKGRGKMVCVVSLNILSRQMYPYPLEANVQLSIMEEADKCR